MAGDDFPIKTHGFIQVFFGEQGSVVMKFTQRYLRKFLLLKTLPLLLLYTYRQIASQDCSNSAMESKMARQASRTVFGRLVVTHSQLCLLVYNLI